MDIAKCSHMTCSLKERCLRYRAKPSEFRQTYAAFKDDNGKCSHFITIEGWNEFTLIPVGAIQKPWERVEDELP